MLRLQALYKLCSMAVDSKSPTVLIGLVKDMDKLDSRLLRLAASKINRRAVNENLDTCVEIAPVFPQDYTLGDKAYTLIQGKKVRLHLHEYFVLKVLFTHYTLTQSVFNQAGVVAKVVVETSERSTTCGICGFPSEQNLCQSCRERLKAFTEYRRESFSVPVNHFNFRGVVRTGLVSYQYLDWDIAKIDDKVYFNLVHDRIIGNVEMPLPFVEYQKPILE